MYSNLRPYFTASIAVAMLFFAGACTESATRTFTFNSTVVPTQDLMVVNVEGPVRLVAAPAGTAITGTVRVIAAGFKAQKDAQQAAELVELVEVGRADSLSLEVRTPVEFSRFSFTTTLELRVPDDVTVSVRTDNGRVTIDRLQVHSVDTTRADVALSFTAGDAVIRTSDGPIVVDGHDGSVDARTSNAAIELNAVAGDARALTTNGFINARVTPYPAGEVILSTTNAGVALVVPRSFGSRLLAVTSGAGLVSISNLNFRPSSGPAFQAEGTIGDGAGIIDVRTTEADIVVEGR